MKYVIFSTWNTAVDLDAAAFIGSVQTCCNRLNTYIASISDIIIIILLHLQQQSDYPYRRPIEVHSGR